MKSVVGIDASQLYPYSMCQDGPQACIRDGTTMMKYKNSGQGRIEFERLKIWSCHTFKQPAVNAKLRVTTLQKTRKIRLL